MYLFFAHHCKFQRGVVKQTLIKLKNWKDRRVMHEKFNKLAKENKLPYRIKHDLTQRRLNLLTKARKTIDKKYESLGARVLRSDDEKEKAFCYCDVNCNLVMRKGKVTRYFNSDKELDAAVTYFFT